MSEDTTGLSAVGIAVRVVLGLALLALGLFMHSDFSVFRESRITDNFSILCFAFGIGLISLSFPQVHKVAGKFGGFAVAGGLAVAALVLTFIGETPGDDDVQYVFETFCDQCESNNPATSIQLVDAYGRYVLRPFGRGAAKSADEAKRLAVQNCLSAGGREDRCRLNAQQVSP